MSKYETISVETRGHVFLIGLDRPGKLNAFNLTMLRELSDAYGALERDASLRCAVLFARGKSFSAGLDLAEVGPAVASGEPLVPEGGICGSAGHSRLARRRPQPGAADQAAWSARYKGWCLTIGMELLLASDIRVAARGHASSLSSRSSAASCRLAAPLCACHQIRGLGQRHALPA